MGTDTIKKTIRMTRELATGIGEITELNPRLKESSVLPYCVSSTAEQIRENRSAVDFRSVIFCEFGDEDKPDVEFPETRSVSISADDYGVILDLYKEQHPGARRFPFPYLIKLTVLLTRQRLRSQKAAIGTSPAGNAPATVGMEGLKLRVISAVIQTENEEKLCKILEVLENEE